MSLRLAGNRSTVQRSQNCSKRNAHNFRPWRPPSMQLAGMPVGISIKNPLPLPRSEAHVHGSTTPHDSFQPRSISSSTPRGDRSLLPLRVSRRVGYLDGITKLSDMVLSLLVLFHWKGFGSRRLISLEGIVEKLVGIGVVSVCLFSKCDRFFWPSSSSKFGK
jgi:hypothetical protein